MLRRTLKEKKSVIPKGKTISEQINQVLRLCPNDDEQKVYNKNGKNKTKSRKKGINCNKESSKEKLKMHLS